MPRQCNWKVLESPFFVWKPRPLDFKAGLSTALLILVFISWSQSSSAVSCYPGKQTHWPLDCDRIVGSNIFEQNSYLLVVNGESYSTGSLPEFFSFCWTSLCRLCSPSPLGFWSGSAVYSVFLSHTHTHTHSVRKYTRSSWARSSRLLCWRPYSNALCLVGCVSFCFIEVGFCSFLKYLLKLG